MNKDELRAKAIDTVRRIVTWDVVTEQDLEVQDALAALTEVYEQGWKDRGEADEKALRKAFREGKPVLADFPIGPSCLEEIRRLRKPGKKEG